MKYFSLNTVENAYKGISTHTNNKFWGILAITSSIGSVVSSQRVFNLNIDNVSNLLENQFCLVENPKKYSRGYTWNVIFSNSWAKYVSSKLLKYSPNIYDVLVWYFRRESFEDTITLHELLSLFFEKTNISVEVAKSIFNFNEKEITFASTKYTENQLLTSLNSYCNNTSNYTTITAEKSFVAANAGELSRAPFIQTLYAGQGAQECMILTQFNFNDYYGNYGDSLVEKTNTKQLGTALFTFDDPTKFVWECIKYFNKQDCLKELFESKWCGRSGFYNNYYTINGCFVAKEDTEGGTFENIEIFNNVLINNNFEVRSQEQIDGFIEAVNILFSGRYKILQDGDFEKATYRLIKTTPVEIKPKYLPYLTALKTKPFLLLAGISGTGKSRLVKELAFMTCPKKSRNTEDQCFYDFQGGVNPANYLLVEVKPNWHDSSELLGYYNALDGKYELTPFIRFAVDAMQHPDVPFFVCLDEMNLAPIEQYFAEYLSVLETRTKTKDTITSAALLDSKKFENIDIEKYEGSDAAVIEYLQENGLIIPSNLFVIGTVNMDDTTHQFSRKVIDRAFTIEMNGGDLMDMYSETNSNALKYTEDPLPLHVMQSNYVTACEAFDDIDIKPYVESIKLRVAELLNAVNGILKDTPFQVSYRVQNELILYIVSLIERANYPSDIEPIIKEATLAILLSKILPRIQGDDKLLGRGDKKDVFTELKNFVGKNLVISTQNGDTQVILYDSLLQQVNDKLDIMHKRLENSYFANFF